MLIFLHAGFPFGRRGGEKAACPADEDVPAAWPAAEDVVDGYPAGKSLGLGRFVVYKGRRGSNAGLISPLGEHSLVQIHEHGFLRFDFPVEKTSHVTVSADRVLQVEGEKR